jgi:hypothetical protein
VNKWEACVKKETWFQTLTGKELEGLVAVLVQLLTLGMAVGVGRDFTLCGAAASPMLIMIWSLLGFWMRQRSKAFSYEFMIGQSAKAKEFV